MTDDPITDLTARASAFLDGETTPDERALADGDSELLAEVERLRQVRAVVGQVDRAPISVRERHLAAALDVWDRMPSAERSGDATPAGAESAAAAGQASITSPTSLGDRRKRRGSGRMLTIAAAAVIVVGGGIVASNFIGSDDSGDVNVASAPDAADEDVSARAELELAAADETFESADESAEEASAQAPVNPDAPTLAGGEGSGAPDQDLEVLSTDDDLAVFANDLNAAFDTADAGDDSRTESAAEPDAAPAEDAPAEDGSSADDAADASATTLTPIAPLCDLVTRIVGPALWEAPGLFNEAVVVGIDDRTGDAVAYRPDDCSEVARTPLQP